MDTERAREIEITEQFQKALDAAAQSPLRAVVGMDGFIDEIVHAVARRESAEAYTRMGTIVELAERIASAAGKSGNIELVTRLVKIGGNGPIMANALNHLGMSVTYIGNLGYPEVHPVFREMASRCHVLSLAEPAHTDAVEFNDGKIMLGKMEMLREVTWERLLEVVGQDTLEAAVNHCRLLALVNWTMLPHASDIWEKILEHICPKISAAERYAFFDLADPEKRTRADIERMLHLVRAFSKYFRVIFGLNERESRQIAHALGASDIDDMPVEEISAFIASKLSIHCVVVHPVQFAVCTIGGKTWRQDGPTTPRPLITTGAGDHFNAAFCVGASLGLGPEACLLMAVCCSGHYVMTAKTPSLQDLAWFMRNWRDKPLIS